MAFLIDTIDSSGLFAQSANSATIATKDSNGNDITATYLTGVDLTPYQTTADMVNYQTTADMSAYATTGDVANKLDASAFSDVSGTFLTAHQPISADEWNDTYETVTGNSGTWDTVSSKQPSGDYYSASNPSGFITEVPSGTLNESGFEYDSDNLISGYNGSAFAGQGGGTSYTGDVQGALDEVYTNSANYLKDTDLDIKTFEGIVSGVNAISGEQILPSALAPNTIQVSTGNGGSEFRYMPTASPWTTADAATGIFKPLMYATGACLTMSSGPWFKGYFKGNEWFVSNTAIGQAVRGEVHAGRGARIWGAEVTGGTSAEFILSAKSGNAGLYLSNPTTSVEFGINSIVDIQTNSATWNEASAVSSKQPSGDYYSASNPSGFISSVPDTYLQNTDLSVTDGKITGISGIPISAGEGEIPSGVLYESGFNYDDNNLISGYNGSAFKTGGSSDISAYDLSAGNGINIVKDDANSAIGIEVTGGGGEVPSGVMAESGLGFNAVNEISGYNGSAIAQYGAEKQWLQHDDTLVHAANSAQYALGVNVSAVGELLGVSGPVLNQETFAGYFNGKEVYQKLFSGTFTRTTAYSTQTISNNLGLAGYTAWIDNGNSWIDYNSASLHLPTFYNIATNRYGNIILYNVTGNYGLQWRGTDSDVNVQSTAYVTVKYIKA